MVDLSLECMSDGRDIELDPPESETMDAAERVGT